jgi:hypothetical protein
VTFNLSGNGFAHAGDARPSHWKPLADQIFQKVFQMIFDNLDERILHMLDDGFTVNDSNDVAEITVRIEVTRPDDDDGTLRFRLRFPGGAKLEIQIGRRQLIEDLRQLRQL